MNLALRTASVFAGLWLLYGAQRPKATAIAIFLWTQIEVNILYVIFFCYKTMEEMVKSSERYEEYGIISECLAVKNVLKKILT